MPMLKLKSEQICDEFKVNKKMYANVISERDEKRLEYIENLIQNQGREFLADPDYWIDEWETITGEDMPQQYIASLPREITGTNAKVNKDSKTYYFYKFLPVITPKGDEIHYPSDRRVMKHKKVYILQDKLVKDLAV